ncbi:hypothetical protein [Breznakia pachnodae]|uniref:Uncharacterized protein n=1 Tax=Breznakia pachnodae TaxID=265178 RepID=A0ABU0E0K9_9FIRM|nr:hypothetical protein [Breznakia pachnodae]MDQ0360246.1 hypothetical protein [Breznakia pachnodae]
MKKFMLVLASIMVAFTGVTNISATENEYTVDYTDYDELVAKSETTVEDA